MTNNDEREAFEDWWYAKINAGYTPLDIAFSAHLEHIEVVKERDALAARQPAASLESELRQLSNIAEEKRKADDNPNRERIWLGMRDAYDIAANMAAKYARQPAAAPGQPRNCQTGWADFCAAGARDGIACPHDSCDIDDGVRPAAATGQEAVAAWQYLYSDPFGDGDVWRTDVTSWNGQRPKASRALYATPAPVGDSASQPAEKQADEIVTQLYRRFKDWSKRGFGPDDVTWCEVKADLLALIAAHPSQPAESKRVMPDEQCENFDVSVKKLAVQYALDRTAAGGWIFENHQLFKFAYDLLARAASDNGGEDANA